MLPSNFDAKERIARRTAREFDTAGYMFFINTGIGIPTMVPQYIKNPDIFIETENGMLGVGPPAVGGEIDLQLIDAGKQCVTETPGCSYFDSADSFGLIRGGHIDATIIGAFEVDEQGSIANWIVPGGNKLGVGGAMDLVAGARRVLVTMQHLNRDGSSKLRRRCTLPITGFAKCSLLITEYAVFSFESGRMVLTDIAEGVTLEDLRGATEAEFEISEDLRVFA